MAVGGRIYFFECDPPLGSEESDGRARQLHGCKSQDHVGHDVQGGQAEFLVVEQGAGFVAKG